MTRTLLFTPVTFNLAETTRMIEVARACRDRWRCVFGVYEPEYVHLIEGAGFEVRTLTPIFTPEQVAQVMAVDQGRGFRHPYTADLTRRRVQAERELIREIGAEAVVMGTNVTSLLSARAEGVPLFYVVPFALTEPHVAQSRRLRLVPGESFRDRFIDTVASAAVRAVYQRMRWTPKSFKVVAREVGAEPPNSMAGLFSGDWTLLTVMPHELNGFVLPETYRRVGPIFAHLDGDVPQEVLDLAAQDKPLVYLALGSSGNRKTAVGAARALGKLDINVVAPIRQYLQPGDSLPANVHVVDLLPAHKLGGVVDAAVLHGGQGTIQTACATGVPFVGMGMQPEQTWNVWVYEQQGNAVCLQPRDVTRRVFTDSVLRVLHDPAVRAAADSVRREYEGTDGARETARVIGEVLSPAQ